jgi:hypothetical protein
MPPSLVEETPPLSHAAIVIDELSVGFARLCFQPTFDKDSNLINVVWIDQKRRPVRTLMKPVEVQSVLDDLVSIHMSMMFHADAKRGFEIVMPFGSDIDSEVVHDDQKFSRKLKTKIPITRERNEQIAPNV